MPRVVIDPDKPVPPVCIVTGETDGVTFERVKVKAMDEVEILKGILVMLVTLGMAAPESRHGAVELSLPFSPRGLRSYRRGRRVAVACFASAIGLLVTLIAVMLSLPAGSNWQQTVPILGVTALLLGLALQVAHQSGGAGPKLVSMAEHAVEVEVQSPEAARAITAALGSSEEL